VCGNHIRGSCTITKRSRDGRAAVADSKIVIRMIDCDGFWTMEMISTSFTTRAKHTMEEYDNNNKYAERIMPWPSQSPK